MTTPFYDEALRLDAVALGRARKGLAQLLGIPLGALDDEVRRRIRLAEVRRKEPAGRTGSSAMGRPSHRYRRGPGRRSARMKKHVAAPDTHFDTAALWCLHAHLIHRAELGIDVTPRLGFQSPEENSGKTTFMKTVRELVPRAQGPGSLSSSALFRAVHARKVTLLVDEGDMLFHPNASPDLFAIFNSGNDRAFAFVTRSVPLGDGQFEDQDFSTFGAMCFTSIDKLWPQSSQSRCIGLPMQPATQEEAAKLIRFRTNQDQELKECGRKFARWAADLPELPMSSSPIISSTASPTTGAVCFRSRTRLAATGLRAVSPPPKRTLTGMATAKDERARRQRAAGCDLARLRRRDDRPPPPAHRGPHREAAEPRRRPLAGGEQGQTDRRVLLPHEAKGLCRSPSKKADGKDARRDAAREWRPRRASKQERLP